MTESGRMDAAEFEHAGMYDPNAPDAAARLALLEYLVDLGATPEDFALVDPGELAVLASFVVLFPDRERITLEEAAARAGATPEFLSRVWRAAGFPDPAEGEASLFAFGIEVFETLAASVELFGEEPTVQFVRVLGAAAARVAEAGVSLFVSEAAPAAVARDPSYIELTRANANGAGLIPALTAGFDVLLRHHMFAARRMDGELTAGVDIQRRSLGFVDLVGSTSLMVSLTPSELSAAMNRFDAMCSDAVSARGGRLVKLIGDEAMFSVADAGVAVDIALELIDLFADDDVLPPVRAAVASGDVVSRDGDYSGPVVNRAARAVKLARPGSLIVDRNPRAGVAAERYSSKSIGAFSLKGFGERIPLYRVRHRVE